jgi:hypothetical protein
MSQERTRPTGDHETFRLSPTWIFASGVLILLLIPVILMNATPGHFGYRDIDRVCTCYVTYTTDPSLASCDTTRQRNCDFRFDQLLLVLSPLDFNR